MKILIVEDEQSLSRTIATYLKQENYLCDLALTFKDAIDRIDYFDYDCILLDISLPDGNGLHLLEALKQDGKSDGVVIISAKNSLDDKVTALKMGADDYLAKPFHLSELSARVASVIRRRRFSGEVRLVANEITIDTSAKNVLISGKFIDLTRKEYDLLVFFITNKNRVLSRNAIVEHLSADIPDVCDNFDSIYTHIKNLKRKLVSAGAKDCLKSVYGVGYKLEAL